MIVRRFKKFFNKNYKGKNARNPTKMSYYKCGGLDHFIKECPLWEKEKAKGKFKEKGKELHKSFSKIDMKRAMVATWGESDKEEEQEQAKEDNSLLYLIAKLDDNEEPLNSKVCLGTIEEELTKLYKSQFLKLLVQTLNYKEVCLKREQVENALIVIKNIILG